MNLDPGGGGGLTNLQRKAGPGLLLPLPPEENKTPLF